MVWILFCEVFGQMSLLPMEKTIRKKLLEFKIPVIKCRCKDFWDQPHYLTIAGKLNKMIYKDFDWKRETKKRDFDTNFELICKPGP